MPADSLYRMYSLQLNDYTFNTLLHQAHSSGYRFSVAESVPSSMQHLLSLNCDGTTTPKPKPAKPGLRNGASGWRRGRQEVMTAKCLGSLFANFTNSAYSASDSGDIVYKCGQKAPAIFVDSDKRAFFDGSNGALEFHGPAGSGGGNRQMLARVDIRLMRGDFIPKMVKTNITGTVKINALELSNSPGYRTFHSGWLLSAASFAKPLITESLNAFFDRYGQFPLPLPEKYTCVSPQFTIQPRSMQIDCDMERAKSLIGNVCRCTTISVSCFCEEDP
jgi:hypothetical protein